MNKLDESIISYYKSEYIKIQSEHINDLVKHYELEQILGFNLVSNYGLPGLELWLKLNLGEYWVYKLYDIEKLDLDKNIGSNFINLILDEFFNNLNFLSKKIKQEFKNKCINIFQITIDNSKYLLYLLNFSALGCAFQD